MEKDQFMPKKRRIILAVLAGVTASAMAFAMAASLGGITSGQLGADSAAIASCDTDGVTTSYTTAYDSTDQRYEVSSVTVAGVNDACDGKTMKVTLSATGGGSLGEATMAIPTSAATSHTVTFSSTPSASASVMVHVVIA
jgi:hypothetical protein